MKKKWREPKFMIQHFVPNEYVSVCGTLDDGTILYAANIEIETAWKRTPAGIENYIQDDEISNPHTIYRGSFYRDKEMQVPDSTANGHEEQEDYGPMKCVQEVSKSPWGYHYHFIDVSNRS